MNIQGVETLLFRNIKNVMGFSYIAYLLYDLVLFFVF